jgi:hypothetical protein
VRRLQLLLMRPCPEIPSGLSKLCSYPCHAFVITATPRSSGLLSVGARHRRIDEYWPTRYRSLAVMSRVFMRHLRESTSSLFELLSFEQDQAVQFVDAQPVPFAHNGECLLGERFPRAQPLSALE